MQTGDKSYSTEHCTNCWGGTVCGVKCLITIFQAAFKTIKENALPSARFDVNNAPNLISAKAPPQTPLGDIPAGGVDYPTHCPVTHLVSRPELHTTFRSVLATTSARHPYMYHDLLPIATASIKNEHNRAVDVMYYVLNYRRRGTTPRLTTAGTRRWSWWPPLLAWPLSHPSVFRPLGFVSAIPAANCGCARGTPFQKPWSETDPLCPGILGLRRRWPRPVLQRPSELQQTHTFYLDGTWQHFQHE